MSTKKQSAPYYLNVKLPTQEEAEQWEGINPDMFNENFIRTVIRENLGSLLRIEYPVGATISLLAVLGNAKKVLHGMWRIEQRTREAGGRVITTLAFTPYSGKAGLILREAFMDYWVTHYDLPYEVAKVLVNYKVPSKREIMARLYDVLIEEVRFRAVLKHPKENDGIEFKNYLRKHGWVFRNLNITHRIRPHVVAVCRYLNNYVTFTRNNGELKAYFKYGATSPEEVNIKQAEAEELRKEQTTEETVTPPGSPKVSGRNERRKPAPVSDIAERVLKVDSTRIKDGTFGSLLAKAARK